MSFFLELKHRKVFRVGVAYALVSWIILQVASIVVPGLNLPDWTITMLIVFTTIGFPIALILAWAYEITPDGVKTNVGNPALSGMEQIADRKIIYTILALVLLVVILQVYDRFTSDSVRKAGNNPLVSSALLVNRFTYQLPENQQFRYQASNGVIALSPDGRRFAYSTNQGLFLREMDELEGRLIFNAEAGTISGLVFSSDSQSITYSTGFGDIRRVPVNGGLSTFMSTGMGRLGIYFSDDMIFFVGGSGIYRGGDEGPPELIIAAQSGESLVSPQLLSGTDTILFSTRTVDTDWDTSQISLYTLSTGERTELIQGSDPHYLPTGHLIYAIDDTLFGVAFDIDSLTLTGDPVPLLQGLVRGSGSPSANYSISEDGTFAYLRNAEPSQLHSLVWIDRDGHEEPINIQARNYQYAQLSPNGKSIALDSRDEENDIWIYDLERQISQRLTLNPKIDRNSLWSPDGRVLFTRYINDQQEIYIQAADGSDSAKQLVFNDDNGFTGTKVPSDVSADGKIVFYFNITPSSIDIWHAALDDEPIEAQPLLNGPFDEGSPTLSPNGQWLAYQSNESGQYEIYVRPYPNVNSGRVQISNAGGSHPLWSPDGSELFFLVLDEVDVIGAGSGALMGVSINLEDDLIAGIPELLIENNFISPNGNRLTYDISADGQRFLMIQKASGNNEETARHEIIIIQNWFEELKQLIPIQ